MTDLLTENARLRAALELAFNRLLSCSIEHDAGSRRFIEIGEWADEITAALATPAPDAVQEAARVLLAACPNPLFDRLKPIIMGEVTESIEYMDEDGDERSYKRNVSWTAMKEIIALALRAIAGGQP